MSVLSDLRPTESHLIYDLVRAAGLDVSDWAKVKGGRAKAAMNPRFCYEWAFVQTGELVILNLWHSDLQQSGTKVFRRLNLRKSARAESNSVRKRRALSMDSAIREAYVYRLPVRVVLLDGDRQRTPVRASRRLLDAAPWAVTRYSWETGDCMVIRGAVPVAPTGDAVDEIEAFGEGTLKRRFVVHRKRERQLRQRKLDEVLRKNRGRLACEVPNCGFDFVEQYGDLGIGYAQVHHKEPLSTAPKKGRKVTLKDLAVVCANCHVMIHHGGECRPLHMLIANKGEPP